MRFGVEVLLMATCDFRAVPLFQNSHDRVYYFSRHLCPRRSLRQVCESRRAVMAAVVSDLYLREHLDSS